MIEALRAAAVKVAEPLSLAAYQRWREGQDPRRLMPAAAERDVWLDFPGGAGHNRGF